LVFHVAFPQDTTSFYPAVTTSVPKRAANSASASGGGSGGVVPPSAGAVGGLSNGYTCTVQFVDDQDETGRVPDRLVPLRYIFKRPEVDVGDE